MSKVTYLLGAGASAGKRTESGSIIEGLPCVNEIPKSISEIIEILKTEILEEVECVDELGLQVREDWVTAQQELLSLFEELEQNTKNNATIDTYAKKLKLKGNRSGLEHVEQLLTLFFLFEQILHNPDSRYDTFLANILVSSSVIPKNINIISWNYDSQIEIVYSDYNSPDKLEIGNKEQEDYQEFKILKVNGTATFKGQDDVVKLRDDIAPKLQCAEKDSKSVYMAKNRVYLFEFIKLYRTYVKGHEGNTNLSFAFDDKKYSEAILRRSDEVINDTDALVIIGYTFPFFNREIDRMVLSRLSPEAKVYIQDLTPEKIKESFKAVLPNFNDNNISLIRDVTQFYLPPEL